MASMQAERPEIFDLRHFGLDYQHVFSNDKWRILQRKSLNTFLHLVFSDQFDNVLPSIVNKIPVNDERNEEIIEGPCFQLELPSNTCNENFVEYYKLLEVLCKESGCERITMRCHPRYKVWRHRLFNVGEYPRAVRLNNYNKFNLL
jgi:hypothetical protein